MLISLLSFVQISFRMPIVGHDSDHLQIAVRRLGRRRLLEKIGLDEAAFDGLLVKHRRNAHRPSRNVLTPVTANDLNARRGARG